MMKTQTNTHIFLWMENWWQMKDFCTLNEHNDKKQYETTNVNQIDFEYIWLIYINGYLCVVHIEQQFHS